MASRVVPGTSLTIALSSPRIAFSSADLPTFGLPTIATLIASGSASASDGTGNKEAILFSSPATPRP